MQNHFDIEIDHYPWKWRSLVDGRNCLLTWNRTTAATQQINDGASINSSLVLRTDLAEAATQFGVLIHKPLVDEDLSLTSQQRWNGWVYMMKPSEIRHESAQKTIRVHTTFTMRLSWNRTTAATQHINDEVAQKEGLYQSKKTIQLGTHMGRATQAHCGEYLMGRRGIARGL